MKDLIGKKVRGFRFDIGDGDGAIGMYYNSKMDNVIGSVGTICEYNEKYKYYKVLFNNSNEEWSYPASLIEQHLVEEPNTNEPSFKDITDSLSSLLEHKNKNYGNSALEPLEVFGNKCKVGTRLDDKIARVKNSEELRRNDVADLLGYLVLTCKEKGWTNFDDLKD